MVTVDRMKKLIGEPATGRETALQYLIDAAAAFAKDYCHIENVDGMDGLLTAMVMEDFNRMGNGGPGKPEFQRCFRVLQPRLFRTGLPATSAAQAACNTVTAMFNNRMRPVEYRKAIASKNSLHENVVSYQAPVLLWRRSVSTQGACTLATTPIF